MKNESRTKDDALDLLLASRRQLHAHPLVAHNGMPDARVEEHALLVLALRIAQEPLVHAALFVDDVFVFLLALGGVALAWGGGREGREGREQRGKRGRSQTYDDVVEHLLLGIHLRVVEGLGQWLFAAEPCGNGGDACADGKHIFFLFFFSKKVGRVFSFFLLLFKGRQNVV